MLAASAHLLARHVADHYEEWNIDKISSFQKHLSRQATSIWRIDF